MFRNVWQYAKSLVIILAIYFTLGLIFRLPEVSISALLLVSGAIYFFRDPLRRPDVDDDQAIISPADGTITRIQHLDHCEYLEAPAIQISIFLSLLDVHVQRAPYAGTIQYIHYQPGTFKPAFLSHADTNEANSIGIKTRHGKIMVKQMTGILARRIVCLVKPEQTVTLGEKLGLIKFGSRVDVFLPINVMVHVRTRQKVRLGQTLIATWPTRK